MEKDGKIANNDEFTIDDKSNDSKNATSNDTDALVDLKTLKKMRGGFSSALTRLYNDGRRHMITGEATQESLNTILRKAKDAFTKFLRANDAVVAINAELDQFYDKQEEFDYFCQECENSLREVDEKARGNCLGCSKSSNFDSYSNFNQNNLTNLMLEQFKSIALTIAEGFSLPKVKLNEFRGDPKQYVTFIHDFKANIASRTQDPAKRLSLLVNYCSGEAKSAIESCKFLEPQNGYQTAMKILSERFGHPYVIARSHIDSIVNGELIKANDGLSLTKLACDMRNCLLCLNEMKNLSDLNASDTLRKIVRRLPYNLKVQWLDRVGSLRDDNRNPSFEDLMLFIERKARILNDPVFGNEFLNEKQKITERQSCSSQVNPKLYNVTTTKNDFNISSNAITGTSTFSPHDKKRCVFCNSAEHVVSGCLPFKNASWEDKKRCLFNNGHCFNCMSHGHITKFCRLDALCNVDGCTDNRKHHTLMHYDNTQMLGCTSADDCISNLQIIPIEVSTKFSNKKVLTYALIDSGSDLCFCTEELAKNVEANETRSMNIALKTVSSVKTYDTKLCDMYVRGVSENDKIFLTDVRTLPFSEFSKQTPLNDKALRHWDHLKDIRIPLIPYGKVTMIIGANRPDVFVSYEQRIGNKPSDPVASLGVLGWSIIGGKRNTLLPSHSMFTQTIDHDLSNLVQRFWTLESVGISYNDEHPRSIEDRKALKIMSESCKKTEDGHYEIALPWKDETIRFPNNRRQAECRLKQLKHRFLRDKSLFDLYTKEINGYLTNGYCHVISSDDLAHKPKTWFLPHHSVRNPNKPDKVRVVFDCAAKQNGISLNDMLLSGPDFTNNICSVLSRFRLEKICILGDIEAMYHQVRVPKIDRDSLRFLWYKDNDLNGEIIELQMNVHLFGASSSASSASYALLRTSNDNPNFSKKSRSAIKRNFYVDDFLKSEAKVELATKMIQEMTDLLAMGGFKLQKWFCNEKSVIDSIPIDYRANSIKSFDLNLSVLPTERTLGIFWNSQSDCFEFRLNRSFNVGSRREILSCISSIYDPLGLISPVVLLGKIVLQDLTRQNTHWDEPIDENIRIRWLAWTSDLDRLSLLKIPRCLKDLADSRIVNTQIHCFCDASETAIGCCAYLRIVYESGIIETKLVLSKAKLSPIKTQTIPKLELHASLLASRLLQLVQKTFSAEIEVNSVSMWSDSMAALQFIKNEKTRFKTFVSNRVAEIRDLTSLEDWRYVPTKLNPADIASRGCSVNQLDQNWFQGPSFLRLDEKEWPVRNLETTFSENVTMEIKKTCDELTCNFNIINLDSPIDKIIHHYSSWYKLKRAFVWFSRIKLLILGKYQMNKNITVSELVFARDTILRHVHNKVFQIKTMHMKSNPLFKLNPFVRDGIIHVGGRLNLSNLPQNLRNPVVLPYKHHVTDLIIREIHESTGHVGYEHVLTLSRNNFWIIKGRAAVRRVLRNCVVCQRYNSKYVNQKMADLPVERLSMNFPFEQCGVDYFGPFLVKHKRSVLKRYCAIFTCLSTRAVHLEVSYDLSSNSFIQAFRRFIARRGTPKVLLSDNGTNFRGAEREMRMEIQRIDNKNFRDFLVKNEITWKFNPPKASHMGGAWERMIRTVRLSFNKMINGNTLTDESFQTLITEVEFIVNSRPLTRSSDNVDDLDVLTPNMILLGKAVYNFSPCSNSSENLRRQWKQVQHLIDVFWKRWTAEYLTLLQCRSKWNIPIENLKKDDIVLIKDETTFRGQWPLGKITSVKTGNDELVRSATVRTQKGEIVRPATKLVKLLMI